MSIYTNDNGTLREIASIFVNDNGVLRTVHTVYINDNGTLRTVSLGVFDFGLADVQYTTPQAPPPLAEAVITFGNDGSAEGIGGGVTGHSFSFDWLTGGLPSAYEIRVTGTGDTPTGSALNTWLSLGTDRSWTLTSSGVDDTKEFDGDYEIRRASDGTVLGSNSFRIEVHNGNN